jgi:hypothetical protein
MAHNGRARITLHSQKEINHREELAAVDKSITGEFESHVWGLLIKFSLVPFAVSILLFFDHKRRS